MVEGAQSERVLVHCAAVPKAKVEVDEGTLNLLEQVAT